MRAISSADPSGKLSTGVCSVLYPQTPDSFAPMYLRIYVRKGARVS